MTAHIPWAVTFRVRMVSGRVTKGTTMVRTIGNAIDEIKARIQDALQEGRDTMPLGAIPDSSRFRELLWLLSPSWMRETEDVIAAAEAAAGDDIGWSNGRGWGLDIAVLIRTAAIKRWSLASVLRLEPRYRFDLQLPDYRSFDLWWEMVSHHGWRNGPVPMVQQLIDEAVRLALLTGAQDE